MGNILLKTSDWGVLTFKRGIRGLDFVRHVMGGMDSRVVALKVDGVLWSLDECITKSSVVDLVYWEDCMGKRVFWESSAYLLGVALKMLFPSAKLVEGRATSRGFYYDVDFGEMCFDKGQLAEVEKKMLFLAKDKGVLRRLAWSREEVLDYFKVRGEGYKLGVLEDLLGGEFFVYGLGGFVDVTKSVLVPHLGYVKVIRLLSVGGVYWRGDANNKQICRIYGISAPDGDFVKAYLRQVEEAKKRDHRTLGPSLGIFTFADSLGLGLPLFLPKGAFMREKLIEILGGRMRSAGFQFITTPHIGHKRLYVTSGHYQKYSGDTFGPISTGEGDEVFLLKPMNCPHHCLVYQGSKFSYRDLPFRIAEFGTVYRYEQHGELHGLIRTRCFTQDDGHIFCRPDQVRGELINSIELIIGVFKTFGFTSYQAQLSVLDSARPDDYIGDKGDWEQAEEALREAASLCGVPTITLPGEAAFYGPKVDFMVKDAMGRQWQLGTVQLDYQLPQRFELSYTTSEGSQARPVMIHRAALGSLERFMGILLEHTAGKLPLSLCLVQVMVLPIAEKYLGYAKQVASMLTSYKIRARVDVRYEKITRKIRDAEAEKIPFMLVVGEREVKEKTVALRVQGKGAQQTLSVMAFVKMFQGQAG